MNITNQPLGKSERSEMNELTETLETLVQPLLIQSINDLIQESDVSGLETLINIMRLDTGSAVRSHYEKILAAVVESATLRGMMSKIHIHIRRRVNTEAYFLYLFDVLFMGRSSEDVRSQIGVLLKSNTMYLEILTLMVMDTQDIYIAIQSKQSE